MKKQPWWVTLRFPLIAGGSSFVIGMALEPLDWSWPLHVLVQIGGAILVTLGIAALIDLRARRRQARLEAAMEQPMTLNEDGELVVPVLGPGEMVQVTGYTTEDGERRILAAQVVRPDGSTRLQSDWSARYQ